MVGKIFRIDGTRYIAFPFDVLKRTNPELCRNVEVIQDFHSGNAYSDRINYLDNMNRRNMSNWEDREDD